MSNSGKYIWYFIQFKTVNSYLTIIDRKVSSSIMKMACV